MLLLLSASAQTLCSSQCTCASLHCSHSAFAASKVCQALASTPLASLYRVLSIMHALWAAAHLLTLSLLFCCTITARLLHSILQPTYSPLAAWSSASTRALTRRTSARLQASWQESTAAKQVPAAAVVKSCKAFAASSKNSREHHCATTTPRYQLHCTRATATAQQQQQQRAKGATTQEGTTRAQRQYLRCPLQSTLKSATTVGAWQSTQCTA
jgi:hypothetical protein